MNPLMRKLATATAPLILVLSLPGQQVPNRTTLNQLLGNARTDEGFGAFTTIFPGAAGILGPLLNRSSVFGSQGPQLVAAGCSYRCPGGNVIWPTPGYGVLTSNALSIDPTANTMIIDYDLPVLAAGFDVLWARQLIGPFTGTVTFRDTNNNTLGSLAITATGPGQVTFAGWQDVGGIASVELVSGNAIHPIVIDNHTYGLDALLASEKESFGAGCNETYASFYETTSSFDLSNRSLSFTYTGNTYVVLPGTAAPLPTTGTPISFNASSVVTFPLNWTLPFPGGTTDKLYIRSRGFVQLSSAPLLSSSLLTNGPVIAAKISDYNHGQGSVVVETDPVAQTATITFLQVPEFGSTGTNTFQYRFDGLGNVELRFGSCVARSAQTGWSPGANNLDPGSIDISAATAILPSDRDRLPLSMTAGYPFLGATVDLVITRVPPGSIATAHVLGLTEFVPGIDLSTLGLPTCAAYTSVDSSHLTLMPAGTSTTFGLAIPNQPFFIGLQLAAQGLALDPAGGHNAFGGLTSNGLRLVIGQF